MKNNKIFVVGLSNTGKHSLMAAFKILGYSTRHYPETFEEIEQFDVNCDVLVWLNYKKLDKQYPGSKFILTNRDKEDWLAATIRHLEANPAHTKSKLKRNFRIQAWGSDEPTKQQLSTAYDIHKQDVERYFGNRDDLLTLDITKGGGWNELCAFIGADIPDEPFPHIDTSY